MILGPDGRPMQSMTVQQEGSHVTVGVGGESYSADPKQVLMEMARAQIQGWSHKRIIAHYQLVGRAASPYVLERALATGRQLLVEAIRRGEVPEDAVITDPKDYGKEPTD